MLRRWHDEGVQLVAKLPHSKDDRGIDYGLNRSS